MKALLVSLLVLASVSTLRAQTAGTILADMQNAAGGKAWESVHSLHLSLTVTAGGQTASAESWEDLANCRYAERLQWPTHTELEGFDGITHWVQGRSGIAYALGDTDSGLIAADEAFRVCRAWWFPSRRPATIAAMPPRTENGRRFDVLDITPEGGRAFQAFIDEATHRLARTVEQQAEDRVVTDFSDDRPVQGLMLPRTIRIGDGTDPTYDQVETVTAVDINPNTPDKLYSLPPLPPSHITLPPGQSSVGVPFEVTGNKLLIPVTLNGKRTVQAEFDSGGGLILQPATVSSLGLATAGAFKETGGGEGAITTTFGRIDMISIGGATIAGLDYDSFGFRPNIPDLALVGQEVLQRFVVSLDFTRRVMTLTRPDAFTYAGKGTVIPFHIQDNQPEIKGWVDGIAGLFTIDTGDNGGLLLLAPFARRHGLKQRYLAEIPRAGHAIGATHGVDARKPPETVAFFAADGRQAVAVHAPRTRISLQTSGWDAHPYIAGNIGLDVLRQFTLTFDYARQVLIFERPGA